MTLAFVIGGAQKSGTSTLDALLRLHPALQMARKKETHFFDDETLDWNAPDTALLDAFYDPQDGRMRGESTPITLYWRPAQHRLVRRLAHRRSKLRRSSRRCAHSSTSKPPRTPQMPRSGVRSS